MTHVPYMPILKAKAGELEALSHFFVRRNASGILPLLEVLPQGLDDESNKTLKDLDFLDKKVNQIRKSLLISEEPLIGGLGLLSPKVELFVDNYFWDSNLLLENQIHPLEYLCRSIANENVSVNPVVGYDRWFDDDGASLYVDALKNLSNSGYKKFCLRVDGDTIRDVVKYEADEFRSNIALILTMLQVDPRQCTVLLDFKDVRQYSPEDLISSSKLAIDALAKINFNSIYIAGGSAPVFVSDVVEKDSSAITSRIEMKTWKKFTNVNPRIGFADYGVRNPESPDNVRNNNVNSKVLYTSDEVFYVVRGSSLKGLKGCSRSEKFIPLVDTLIDSKFFTECHGCWGDLEIYKMLQKPTADLTKWVCFSTNRHLCYVMDEVFEHQRLVVARLKTANKQSVL